MCWDVFFNPGLGKMTFDIVTVSQVVWWKWTKKTVFWACIFWFQGQVEAIELYPDSQQ